MAQELGATVLEDVHQAEVQVETIPGAVLLVALLEVILVADLVVQLVVVLALEDKQVAARLVVAQLVAARLVVARQVAALLVERRSHKHALTTKTKTEIGVTPQTLLNGDSELFEEKEVLYPLVLILSNLKISKA